MPTVVRALKGVLLLLQSELVELLMSILGKIQIWLD